MTNTRWKLNEATYFLERMKENSFQKEPFCYNLSAFLAAARSIYDIMWKEFKKRLGFTDQYPCKDKLMVIHRLTEYLNEQRDLTIHQRPIQPRSEIIHTQTISITASPRIEVILAGTNNTVREVKSQQIKSPQPQAPSSTTEIKYYFSDIEDEDVITVCESYLSELEKLVTECENKFSAS